MSMYRDLTCLKGLSYFAVIAHVARVAVATNRRKPISKPVSCVVIMFAPVHADGVASWARWPWLVPQPRWPLLSPRWPADSPTGIDFIGKPIEPR